jgi:hypothetical protein
MLFLRKIQKKAEFKHIPVHATQPAGRLHPSLYSGAAQSQPWPRPDRTVRQPAAAVPTSKKTLLPFPPPHSNLPVGHGRRPRSALPRGRWTGPPPSPPPRLLLLFPSLPYLRLRGLLLLNPPVSPPPRGKPSPLFAQSLPLLFCLSS